jgi:hypothetical protein
MKSSCKQFTLDAADIMNKSSVFYVIRYNLKVYLLKLATTFSEVIPWAFCLMILESS